MKKALLILSIATSLIIGLAVTACSNNPVQDAIDSQLKQYPESRVQDIYKSFCQDNLGPGHLIPNPEAARKYIMSELETYRDDIDRGLYDKPEIRYITVGDKGNYIRVDLSVVLDSLVDADCLLDAFVRSANEGKTLSEDEWKEKWSRVAATIQRHFPDIPDAEEDLSNIDSLMASGHYIFHHSQTFNDAYHPHYRIVARDIFDEEIKKKL